MSDETIDGIFFEMALAVNPKITARREAWYARRRAFAETIKDKTKAEMIAELKAANPAYIIDILEQHSLESIRDRYIGTFAR